MELKFRVQTKIQKPVNEVFDAIHNPKKLSGYFTTGGASGPLDEGKTVYWKFHDSSGLSEEMPVKVSKTVPNKLIQFSWDAGDGTYDAKSDTKPKSADYKTN